MNLEEIRSKISNIDNQITALLEERMALVDQIARYKKVQGIQVTDSSREKIVLENVAKQVKKAEYTQSVVNTYEDVLRHSRAFQEELIKKMDEN